VTYPTRATRRSFKRVTLRTVLSPLPGTDTWNTCIEPNNSSPTLNETNFATLSLSLSLSQSALGFGAEIKKDKAFLEQDTHRQQQTTEQSQDTPVHQYFASRVCWNIRNICKNANGKLEKISIDSSHWLDTDQNHEAAILKNWMEENLNELLSK